MPDIKISEMQSQDESYQAQVPDLNSFIVAGGQYNTDGITNIGDGVGVSSRGGIDPDDSIPFVTLNGLYRELDGWVLEGYQSENRKSSVAGILNTYNRTGRRLNVTKFDECDAGQPHFLVTQNVNDNIFNFKKAYLDDGAVITLGRLGYTLVSNDSPFPTDTYQLLTGNRKTIYGWGASIRFGVCVSTDTNTFNPLHDDCELNIGFGTFAEGDYVNGFTQANTADSHGIALNVRNGVWCIDWAVTDNSGFRSGSFQTGIAPTAFDTIVLEIVSYRDLLVTIAGDGSYQTMRFASYIIDRPTDMDGDTDYHDLCTALADIITIQPNGNFSHRSADIAFGLSRLDLPATDVTIVKRDAAINAGLPDAKQKFTSISGMFFEVQQYFEEGDVPFTMIGRYSLSGIDQHVANGGNDQNNDGGLIPPQP